MELGRMIFSPFLLLAFLQGAQASVYVEIRLLTYEHGCEEGSWILKTDCDPQFKFCIDRPTTDVEFNEDSCHYSYVKESSPIHDDDKIDFQALDDNKGLPIPWKFKAEEILDSQILFAVDIDDHDPLFDDDMVTFRYNMTLDIAATERDAKFRAFYLSLGHHDFSYQIRLYCAENYYDSDCQTYCLASSDDSGHYVCEQGTGRKLCLKGWEGGNCDVDINECDLNFCEHGTCENSPGDYECHCLDYFTGRNCTVMTNPCGSNPCHMGSVCDGDPQTFTYTCHCIPGWEGMQCNVKSDPCDEKPCQNDGQCESTDSNFSYTCSCPYGWLGKDCDERLDPCDSNPCLNAGTCIGDLEHLNYTCVCVSGWLGERCELEFEPCLSEPCQNDAICAENITTHSYLCSCQSGWEGIHCEIKSDPCESLPCQNNGTCRAMDQNHSYTCTCMRNYAGKHCERDIPDGNTDQLSEAKSSSVSWRIPVAVVAAVLLLFIIAIIFVFWRKTRGKDKDPEYVSDIVTPVVVFGTTGATNLAFENQTYAQENRANQGIETGRGSFNGVILPPPTNFANRDNLFNPIKPNFVVDDKTKTCAAVGGACSDEDHSAKKTGRKGSATDPVDATDLRYSQVSALSKRPLSERADENPYQDFRSLSWKQLKEDFIGEEDSQEEEDDDKEEEDPYQTLDEVASSVTNSYANDRQDMPPALPPFNVGVQKNPLSQLSNDSDVESGSENLGGSSEPQTNRTTASHGTFPDSAEITSVQF